MIYKFPSSTDHRGSSPSELPVVTRNMFLFSHLLEEMLPTSPLLWESLVAESGFYFSLKTLAVRSCPNINYFSALSIFYYYLSLFCCLLGDSTRTKQLLNWCLNSCWCSLACLCNCILAESVTWCVIDWTASGGGPWETSALLLQMPHFATVIQYLPALKGPLQAEDWSTESA